MITFTKEIVADPRAFAMACRDLGVSFDTMLTIQVARLTLWGRVIFRLATTILRPLDALVAVEWIPGVFRLSDDEE